MDKKKIEELLEGYPPAPVGKFASYAVRLASDPSNKFMSRRTEEDMAELYKRVAEEGLEFDGEHVTLNSRGISYDYVAYKNRMLLAHPETKLDLDLVYEGDTFEFSKESGAVTYTHKIGDPFKRKDENIIGGYCVIRNKKGEFLTILNKEDFDQHRKLAKMDAIWRNWLPEMCKKTLIKKAVKYHFNDVYKAMDEDDNENYDLEIPLEIELKDKQAIDKIATLEGLKQFYMQNRGRGKGIEKYIAIRKEQIQSNPE